MNNRYKADVIGEDRGEGLLSQLDMVIDNDSQIRNIQLEFRQRKQQVSFGG